MNVIGRSRARPAAALSDRLEGLLEAVARGDQRAYEEVYQQISPPVYGLVRRVLRDPAQTEEVTQEVLLQVWREASRYDEQRGSAMGWVMTIAHRRAVDRVRSEQATTDRQARIAIRGAEIPFDSVAEDVANHLDRDAVRRCLSALSDLQREAVTLAYYGGRTCREVAESLGVPLGTVKTRVRDGLIRLRDCLGVAV